MYQLDQKTGDIFKLWSSFFQPIAFPLPIVQNYCSAVFGQVSHYILPPPILQNKCSSSSLSHYITYLIISTRKSLLDVPHLFKWKLFSHKQSKRIWSCSKAKRQKPAVQREPSKQEQGWELQGCSSAGRWWQWGKRATEGSPATGLHSCSLKPWRTVL